MPNIFDTGLSLVTAAYQTTTASTPLLQINGGDGIAIIPGTVGQDPMFVDGGVAEGSQIIVQTRSALWGTPPEKGDTAILSGHATAPNGNYQVLNREDKEGVYLITLGNFDAAQ